MIVIKFVFSIAFFVASKRFIYRRKFLFRVLEKVKHRSGKGGKTELGQCIGTLYVQLNTLTEEEELTRRSSN